MMALRLGSARAQNEPEPEATPTEQTQAEPTEFTPTTAGEAERGAPNPSPEAATAAPTIEGAPAESLTPAEAPSSVETASSNPTSMETPAAPSSPPQQTTISPEPRPRGSGPAPNAATKSMAPASISGPAPNVPSGQEHKAAKTGNGPQIVPENSPFAGFGNQKGPTNITSDTATLDYQSKFFLYTGHVHAVQAGGDLTSDTLRAQYGQDFHDIKMVFADGNVRMSQGTRWVTSDHAVLDQTKHILTFRGNPVVHDAADQITGSLITVDLVSGKSTVENPRMVIFPRESKNPDNVLAPGSP
jgi:lipopolysaccharide transport protein LptA